MISQEFLDMLVCPETKEPVSLADAALIEKINAKIREGTLFNRGNQAVTKNIDGGLMRRDKQFLYPIREDIPIMLIEEAIPLKGFS